MTLDIFLFNLISGLFYDKIYHNNALYNYMFEIISIILL